MRRSSKCSRVIKKKQRKYNFSNRSKPATTESYDMLVNTTFFMPLHIINGYNELQCIIRKLIELLCKQHALHGPMCVLNCCVLCSRYSCSISPGHIIIVFLLTFSVNTANFGPNIFCLWC